MRRISILACALAVTALLLFIAPAAMHAQTGGGYDLTWNTIDGGGGTSTGGEYTLMGTAGQPDGGPHSGGGFTVAGGFWIEFGGFRVNLPVILR